MKQLYNSEQKTLNYNACSEQLTLLKKEIEWLKEVDKFALQNRVTSIGLTQNISQTLISPCRASCYNGEAARSSPIALGVS
ncbi:hypothetical protein [Nostoc sp. NOS(2021)]|uniref:hypothetical protein n=1 Tax=Nostoc sp. NOS(2021) TaxID=2815407 RepID=UPI0025F991B3|nr:hypothetical protein [Nostoc sp. NOS(2021)]